MRNYFNPETGKLTITQDISEIKDEAFIHNKEIKSINILSRPIGEEYKLKIGNYAFSNCDIAGSLYLPDCVSNGYRSFANNTNLTSVVASPLIHTVGHQTFLNTSVDFAILPANIYIPSINNLSTKIFGRNDIEILLYDTPAYNTYIEQLARQNRTSFATINYAIRHAYLPTGTERIVRSNDIEIDSNTTPLPSLNDIADLNPTHKHRIAVLGDKSRFRNHISSYFG